MIKKNTKGTGLISKISWYCWNNFRHEIQGLTPPNKRSYEDFDAGSKEIIFKQKPFLVEKRGKGLVRRFGER